MSDASKYRDPGHELTDAKAGAVFWSAVGFAAITVAAFVITYFLVQFLARPDDAPPDHDTLSQPAQVVPGPHLQVDPHSDYRAYVTQEDSLLNSYGWVMREAGVVRVPVDSAMVLMLERGFPARETENRE